MAPTTATTSASAASRTRRTLTKNALTYRHFANGNPLPTTHPIQGIASGAGNSQVHNGGEVWSTMLWECYASLLNAYPFQEAQDRMKAYLVAAYKVTPIAPTLLEARDALLAAAAATDPADYQPLRRRPSPSAARASAPRPPIATRWTTWAWWRASPRAATSRSSASAWMTPPPGCDADGVLDVGEMGVLNVTVRNTGEAPCSAPSPAL